MNVRKTASRRGGGGGERVDWNKSTVRVFIVLKGPLAVYLTLYTA